MPMSIDVGSERQEAFGKDLGRNSLTNDDLGRNSLTKDDLGRKSFPNDDLGRNSLTNDDLGRICEEIITDPHNQARDMIIEVLNQVTGENQQQAGLVMKLSETPGSIRWGPTLMGQDTDTVLYDLGYSNKQMAELRTSGVIA